MSLQRIIIFVVIGAAIWFIAAVILRKLGGGLFDGGAVHIGVYLGTLVSSPALIWVLAKLTGTAPGAMLAPSVVALTTALFLDGIAISWAPAVYGGAGPALALNAAWLLWAVGCFLLSAMAMQKTS